MKTEVGDDEEEIKEAQEDDDLKQSASIENQGEWSIYSAVPL